MSSMSTICPKERERIVNQMVTEFPKFGAAQINTLIDWKGKQPPYCKICHVRFTGPENALVHFNYDLCTSHFSRLVYVKRRYLGEIRYGCNVCCCEVNTTEVLKIHENSPKHRKKIEARDFILDLSRLYDRLNAILLTCHCKMTTAEDYACKQEKHLVHANSNHGQTNRIYTALDNALTLVQNPDDVTDLSKHKFTNVQRNITTACRDTNVKHIYPLKDRYAEIGNNIMNNMTTENIISEPKRASEYIY